MIFCEEYKERDAELTQQTINYDLANSAFKELMMISELNSNSEIFLRLPHRDSDKEEDVPLISVPLYKLTKFGGGDW